MSYERGQIVPLDYERAPFGAPMAPCWFILLVPPQKEAGAAAWARRAGALETWFPTEKAWRFRGGKAAARRNKVEYRRLIAPGYVFVLTDRVPAWDVIRQRSIGRVSGVVSRDGAACAIATDELANMAQVPQRLERMRRAEDERRRFARQAKHPVAGQMARICEGPMSGFMVDVERVHAGIAHWIIKGIRGNCRVDAMERVDG
ncbi:transcription termination/antitermination protein NusG [Marinibacterium sp. SX1]|uniref:transcription termination/antitermination protein NusG n=1 Tax=Marinibacterium sp. SX1 TaxID=3388424 RepID=UPI003D168774